MTTASEQMSFVADSISSVYSRIGEIPALTDASMSNLTPDGLHILHSFLASDPVLEGELIFKSVDEVLEADGPPTEYVIEKLVNNETSAFSRLNDESLNSFFEEVQKHEVYESRYPTWNPGAKAKTMVDSTESYATADEFED